MFVAATPTAPKAQAVARDTGNLVLRQMEGDYPAPALKWITTMPWTGPVQVPLTQIDWSTSGSEWTAAKADRGKIARFTQRIRGGFRKPLILVRTPGTPLLRVVDGHRRALAYRALGIPVTAWVGTAKTADGPWSDFHSQQKPDSL